MKIEDLKEHNPVWKLQVTDDENKVLFEKKYLDRNDGERDFKVDIQMPNNVQVNKD